MQLASYFAQAGNPTPLNIRPKTRKTLVPRNLSTELESRVRRRVPREARVAGPGRGGRRGAARSPLHALCPPSPSLAPSNSPPLPRFLFPLPRPPPPRTAELELSPPSRAASGGGAKPRLFLAPGEQSPLPGAERRGRGAEVSRRVGRRRGRALGAKARRRPHSAPGPVRSRCGGRAQRQPTRAGARRARASPWARSLPWFWVHVPSRALGPRSVAHARRPSLGSVLASPRGIGCRVPASCWGAPAPGVSISSMHTARASGAAVSRSFCPFPPGVASLTQWRHTL